MKKQKVSVQKLQILALWICAISWLVTAVIDFIIDRRTILTILHCIAAGCFLLSAIAFTKDYRNKTRNSAKP